MPTFMVKGQKPPSPAVAKLHIQSHQTCASAAFLFAKMCGKGQLLPKLAKHLVSGGVWHHQHCCLYVYAHSSCSPLCAQ